MSTSENPYQSPNPLTTNLHFTRRKKSLYGLSGAAFGLLIISTLELLFCLLAVPTLLVGINAKPSNQTIGGVASFDGVMSILAAGVCFFRAAINIAGALAMRRRKNYGLALTAAVLASMGFVFMPLWLGVPFGVWALIALLPAETRAVFTEAE